MRNLPKFYTNHLFYLLLFLTLREANEIVLYLLSIFDLFASKNYVSKCLIKYIPPDHLGRLRKKSVEKYEQVDTVKKGNVFHSRLIFQERGESKQ